jgi:hypothetical protein
MALIVEDGTAMSTSESYTSVAEADLYLGNNGITTWFIMSVTEKEQALRRATNYTIQRYRGEWKGQRVNKTQRLDWPRWNVKLPDLYGTINAFVLPTEITETLKNATSELALIGAAGELTTIESQNVLSNTVGPIKVVYDPSSSIQRQYRAVHRMLSIYLANMGSSSTISLNRS